FGGRTVPRPDVLVVRRTAGEDYRLDEARAEESVARAQGAAGPVVEGASPRRAAPGADDGGPGAAGAAGLPAAPRQLRRAARAGRARVPVGARPGPRQGAAGFRQVHRPAHGAG